MAHQKQQSGSSAINYLRFSRSQRRAMIMLFVCATGFLAFAHWKKQSQTNLSAKAFAATETLLTVIEKEPVNSYSERSFPQYPAEKSRESRRNKSFEPASLTLSPAIFDPNTASFEDLTALGLNEKAAHNIINYREKGGRFKKPEDLGKIYSLKPHEVEQLVPFVQIENNSEIAGVAGNGMADAELTPAAASAKYKPIPVTVNVNRADSMTWQLLPGIGAKRASSILKYREKLGGFVSVDQVAETFGLPDSVFQKIKPNLTLEPGQIEQLSLNHATEAELKAHPYIGWQWAKLIVNYRNQHGPYASVDDLMKIHVMKKDWIEQVRPYLKAD